MRILSVLCLTSFYRFCGCMDPLDSQNASAETPDFPIDRALFDVVEDVKDKVPILRITARTGIESPKLIYREKEVWPGKKGFFCTSAILHLDEGSPKLADVKIKDKNDRENTIYKYKEGGRWRNAREATYMSKVEVLKEKYERAEMEACARKSSESVQEGMESESTSLTQPIESSTASGDASPEHVETESQQNITSKENIENPPKETRSESPMQLDSDLEEPVIEVSYSPPRPRKRRMFDIAYPDHKISRLYDYSYNGVTYKTYSISGDVFVEGVSDAGNFLWKYYLGRCVKIWLYYTDTHSLCRLDINDCPVITPFYFEKNGESWDRLEDDDFHKKLYILVSAEYKGIRMDVTSLSSDLFNVTEYIDKKILHSIVFSPKYKVTSVYDESKVWEARNGQRCTTAHFYTDKFINLCLLVILDDSGNSMELYFEYDKYGWKTIENDQFSEHIRNMEQGNPQDKHPYTTTPAVIDVHRVDPRFINTYSFTLNGLSIAKHVSLPDKHVNKVLCGSSEVWRAPNDSDERCLSTDFFSKDNSRIIVVHLKRGTNLFSCSFEHTEKGWVCSEESEL